MFDESQPEPATAPDTNNHTNFYGSDTSATAGSRRLDGTESLDDYYSRLANLNRGIWTGEWADKTQLRNADNLAVFDAISSQLELTDWQKQIGREAFGELNIRKLSSPNGIDTPLVAIMTAAMACQPDGRIYHPNRGADTNDGLFVSLLADLGYRDRVVRSCYAKVADRVNL